VSSSSVVWKTLGTDGEFLVRNIRTLCCLKLWHPRFVSCVRLYYPVPSLHCVVFCVVPSWCLLRTAWGWPRITTETCSGDIQRELKGEFLCTLYTLLTVCVCVCVCVCNLMKESCVRIIKIACILICSVMQLLVCFPFAVHISNTLRRHCAHFYHKQHTA